MCDNDFVECELPKHAIDLAVTAWKEFSSNPCDFERFVAADWLLQIAFVKWQSYATERRIAGR